MQTMKQLQQHWPAQVVSKCLTYSMHKWWHVNIPLSFSTWLCWVFLLKSHSISQIFLLSILLIMMHNMLWCKVVCLYVFSSIEISHWEAFCVSNKTFFITSSITACKLQSYRFIWDAACWLLLYFVEYFHCSDVTIKCSHSDASRPKKGLRKWCFFTTCTGWVPKLSLPFLPFCIL